MNYIPDLATGMADGAPVTALHYVVAFVFSFGVPFFEGFRNIIGDLIIAFGLWEAWKFNKPVHATISGPYTVTPVAPPITNV
jgi:hypothetical protein